MNTKNNKRRRQSVEKIQRVFLDLLQSRELKQIYVSDICKAAAINRSTFYANFMDVYDLADKIKERLEGEVHVLYAKEREDHFNSNNYLRLFRHIRDNQLFYQTFFKLGYDSTYQIETYDTQQAERHFGNRHVDYHITFFQSGFNAILKKWLAGGCQESPEDMDEIIRSEYRGRV